MGARFGHKRRTAARTPMAVPAEPRFRGEWRKPCPGRDAIRAGKRSYHAEPCSKCGTTLKYAAGGACAHCTKERAKQARAPWPHARHRAFVELMAAVEADSDVLGLSGDERLAHRMMIASTFAGFGASAVRFSATYKVDQGTCLSIGKRFRAAGIWTAHGANEELSKVWMEGDPNESMIARCLDAMVGAGRLLRTADGRYSAAARL